MRLLIPLIVIVTSLVLVKLFLDHRNVDRPQRIGRREARALLAENKVLRQLVNNIDAEARAEYTVRQTPVAGVISTQITEVRKTLDY